MLAYPGEIHNAVVRHIANRYGYNTEQRIQYAKGGFGRADLISPSGQVWDVKRDKPRQINKGIKQVKKYVENVWMQQPDTTLSVGGSDISSGSFHHKSGLTTYRVTYRNAGDGVIAYDYSVWDYDYETLENTVQIVGMVVIAVLIVGFVGSVLPGILFA